MPQYSRAHEKFDMAAVTLATSPKDINSRLFDAASYIAELRPEELPETMRRYFIELREQLTSAPPVPGFGSLRATIDGLSTDEAASIARAIWSLYTDLKDQR